MNKFVFKKIIKYGIKIQDASDFGMNFFPFS